MKYFTPAWCSGELDNAFEDYKKHLAPLLPKMPPDVQRLATTINLHDGLLWLMRADIEQATLLLSLRCGDLQVGYFDLELYYLQVLFSPATVENLAGLVADPSGEDLDYHSRCSVALYGEVDMEEETFVHRVLFTWPNAYHEVMVRFRDLQLRTTPREGRFNIIRT